MESDLIEGSHKRESSVSSSEVSSRASLSSGQDNEREVISQTCVLKQKSSSLSCLPDRITDFDNNSFTLPSNLSSVEPFRQHLARDGASSAKSWYETAECLEGSGEELTEKSSNDDPRSSLDLNNSMNDTSQLENDSESKEKPASQPDIDLPEINTVTRTFVRSSALSILSKFPQTETVHSMEKGPPGVRNDEGMRRAVVNEDTSERIASPDSVQIRAVSSEKMSAKKHNGQDEVASWSSTCDVDGRQKKKRLFNKKKVQDISRASTAKFEEGSKEVDREGSGGVTTKVKKRNRKEKGKTGESSVWRNFFRNKNNFTDEKARDVRSKKERKPLQKSHSFNTSSVPRSTQLNRMNSIRKWLKRPRDSAVLAETKPIDNVKCMEISSPIIKSDFRSQNLVDREVILGQRAYRTEKVKSGKDKIGKNSTTDVSSVLHVQNGDDNSDNRNTNSGNSDSNAMLNGLEHTEESPVPPVRRKHLQRKQTLSIQGDEEATEENSCEGGGNEEALSGGVEERIPEAHLHERNVPNETVECSVSRNYNCTENHPGDSSADHVGVEPLIEGNAIDCGVTSKSVGSGKDAKPQTTLVDDNEDMGFVFVDNNSSNLAKTQHILSSEGSTLPDPSSSSSSLCRSPPGTGVQSEHEFEEVFVDSISDEKISIDSATLEDKSEVSRTTSRASMPAGRWSSDVSSDQSQRAIEKAIKRKPASFSGVRMSSRETQKVNTTSSPGDRSPATQPRRSSLAFRVPSFRFEQSEPVSLITDMVPTTFSCFLTDRRSQIILELFTTERTYVRGLETMIELFKKPMLAGMDEKDVDAIFSNLNDIFALNKDLLFLLWEKVKHWSNDQCIAHIFTDLEERFKIYATYCKNFDRSDSVYKQKLKRNKEFERFLKACYQDPMCQPGLDLPAYLITIVQRIPRYLLLLKDFYKKTPSSHLDYKPLELALNKMNKVAEFINSQLQEVHGKKAMQELRSTVIGLKAYEVKGRTLLKEAEVCLMSPKKPYKCLLFNDIMVFAVQGSKDRSEIEMTLELRTLWFEDLKKQDPQTTKCDAIELYTPHRPYTMYTCSRAEKRVWLQKLRTAIVTLLYGPDCEDPDGVDISRRKASDTYFDGSVYCGEYVNGKRHGQGVMAWPNRTRYEGLWADDERHGQGQLTYYTGEKYVGSWVADKKEGEGRQTYVNGDVYQGQWKDGKMHGKGAIDFANGDRYVGELKCNEVEGCGEMTCSSGLVYKGEWKKSKRHGSGHLSLPNGNEYIGEMLNDRVCGDGRMKYSNGDEYTGEWVNELRHGRGVLKLVNGTVYDGQWNQDFMNGQGKMKYPSGDEYTGTWFQNKRVGKGQLVYAHGDTYNGQWHADMKHGKGTMYYRDGSVYEGSWENGERHGHGKTTFKDKSLYEGDYCYGFRHGRGKLIYSNNVCYVGEWKSDKFDGHGVFSDPNTEYSYQGDWNCGMREGSGIEIYYRTRYEGGWKANMKHGTGVEKSHAGHVFKGTWKENRKHGEGTRTLRSNVEEVQLWHEGHLVDSEETVAEGLPPLPRR